MNRLVLVGASSFIARHVAASAVTAGIPVHGVAHDSSLTGLGTSDVVVNFGISPFCRSRAYDPASDNDLRVARLAGAAGARFVLLSTRKVYGGDSSWGAKETSPARGDGSPYGDNKARAEQAVLAAVPGALILRLANIFGQEYLPERPRRTFMGLLLAGLRERNTITFDMAAATRRDFLPVERCASAILEAAMAGASGILNLGSGFPTPCGAVAGWVMAGYGSGNLAIRCDEVQDEFFLDMTKWREQGLCPPITAEELQTYCVELGRRLRNA
jgi:nucleoside-diphosphate-sugar epimerase